MLLLMQVAQLQQAQAKAAAQFEVMQAEHSSLQTIYAAAQLELQGQQSRFAEAQGAAECAAAEQEAYVQLVCSIMESLPQLQKLQRQ